MNDNDVVIIPPHKYPIWVVFSSVVVFSALVYSLFSLPRYFVASQELKSGHNAYKNSQYVEAIKFYESVLAKVSTSKEAKISLAEVYFAKGNSSDIDKGISYLQGVSLDKYDLKRLAKTMPKEYQQEFEKLEND